MAKLKKLFEPITIRNLTIRNRITMSSMDEGAGRINPDKFGFQDEQNVQWYKARARGGTGMINSGYRFVHPRGQGLWRQHGLMRDEQIPMLKRTVDEVHKYGAKFCLQMNHAGRESSKKWTGLTPIGPSTIQSVIYQEPVDKMSQLDIKEIIGYHVGVARRAKEAGCDAVEVHGAHGYLCSQFLTPLYNDRTDKYSCDNLENATRFWVELLDAMREEIGPDMVLGTKMSADEYYEGGITLDYAKEVAKALEPHLDYIIASAAMYDATSFTMCIPPMAIPLGPIVHLAAGLREVVDIPIGAIAAINDPQQAEEILEKGFADFCVIGRALIADPDWANKAQEGRFEDINTCIRCNQGCIDRIFMGQKIHCTVNALAGREVQLPDGKIPKAEKKKKVFIAGGGVAGMECARVCAIRGHDVTIYEKDKELGGQALLAAKPPKRQDFGVFTDYLKRELDKLKVEIVLNTELTPEMVKKAKSDVVVVATGAVPVIPGIEGVWSPSGDLAPNVTTAFEVLREEVKVGEKVVVIGHDTWALETAEFLAEQGKDVTVVGCGVTSKFLEQDPWMTQWGMDIHGFVAKAEWIPRLLEKVKTLIHDKTVKEITPNGVLINEVGWFQANMQDTNFGPDDADELIEADTVVFAISRRPTYADPISYFKGSAPEIYAIGTCVEHPQFRKPRMMFATRDGYWTAVKI